MKTNIEKLVEVYKERIAEIDKQIVAEIKKGKDLHKKSDDYMWYCLDVRALRTELSTLKKVLHDLTGKIFL